MSDQNDMLKMLVENDRRLSKTEVKEVLGNIPGFTSFYATGSFTPTLVGAGTAGTFTYTANATLVEWTRIGNRLLFNGRITISATAVAPVGNMSINGWPFAGVTDANMAIAGVGAMGWRNVTFPAGFTALALQFSNNTTPALIRSGSNVNVSQLQGADLVGGAYDFRFGGEYKVA